MGITWGGSFLILTLGALFAGSFLGGGSTGVGLGSSGSADISAVVSTGIALLDRFVEGKLIGEPANFQGNGKAEACMAIAFQIKLLVQRLRRLFRRSRNSRSECPPSPRLRIGIHSFGHYKAISWQIGIRKSIF